MDIMNKSIVIDQRFDEIKKGNLGCSINEGFPFVGQTFMAGISGSLVGVSVHIRSKRSMNPNRGFEFFNLKISLFNVKNGFPKDELVFTILDKDESTIEELIRFPSPIKQLEGEQFAIVASYPNGPKFGAGQELGNWSGLIGNMYPRGNLISGNGSSWFVSSMNNHDVFFRTYVER